VGRPQLAQRTLSVAWWAVLVLVVFLLAWPGTVASTGTSTSHGVLVSFSGAARVRGGVALRPRRDVIDRLQDEHWKSQRTASSEPVRAASPATPRRGEKYVFSRIEVGAHAWEDHRASSTERE